jgi:hypothetical protein
MAYRNRSARLIRPALPIAAILLSAWTSAPASAQSPLPGTSTPPAPATQDKPAVTLDSLPPGLKLGARVNFVQRQTTVAPTLVLVADEASYLKALSGWSTSPAGALRYPILIDDGSWVSQQRIMRFVRAFGPKSVVRYAATGEDAKLDGDAMARASKVDHVVARAWGAVEPKELGAKWKEIGFEPPGAVIAWMEDPAWTAAAALAASRGQPILWIKCAPGEPSAQWNMADAENLNTEITRRLAASGHEFAKLGDSIDALTLCANVPVKVWLGEGDKRQYLALTDILGRDLSSAKRERWAWTGQIIGSSAEVAYSAMSALFLTPDTAWLFDGYESTQPWVLWDMTKSAEALKKIGMAVTVDDAVNGATLATWRTRVAGVRTGLTGLTDPKASDPGFGIDAGLIAVTTKGNPDFFDLAPPAPTTGKSIDVPILRRPAMLLFTHSWSLNQPTNRATIGAVWLERGVYAYFGSVHEPFLQSFLQTPAAMARIAAGFAFAPAMRAEEVPMWKLAVMGDPLITVGPSAKRLDGDMTLAGSADIGEGIGRLLKDKKYALAMRDLALVGRDRDAARLILALAKDDAPSLTSEVALIGLRSAFNLGDYPAFLAAARAALPALNDPARMKSENLYEVRDMVWHVLTPALDRASTQEADLLSACLRPENLVRDTAEAMRAARAHSGDAAARRILEKARLSVTDRKTSDELDKLAN